MLQASQLGVYKAFVDNYKIAVETAEKCSQANIQFQKISEVSPFLVKKNKKGSRDRLKKKSDKQISSVLWILCPWLFFSWLLFYFNMSNFL